MIGPWLRAILHATGAIGAQIVFTVIGSACVVATVALWLKVDEKTGKRWLAYTVSAFLALVLFAFFWVPFRIMEQVGCGGGDCEYSN